MPVPTADGPPRRRLGPWIAAVVLLVAALVLGGVWLGNRQGADPAAAPATAAAQTTTQAAAPAPVDPTTPAPAATTAAPPAATTAAQPEGPTAAQVQSALTGYYALLPDKSKDAYDLTGPTLQSLLDENGYRDFWKDFDQVTLQSVDATDGSLQATATITFVGKGRDGATQTEQHALTLVEGTDGQLLVDVDQFVAIVG